MGMRSYAGWFAVVTAIGGAESIGRGSNTDTPPTARTALDLGAECSNVLDLEAIDQTLIKEGDSEDAAEVVGAARKGWGARPWTEFTSGAFIGTGSVRKGTSKLLKDVKKGKRVCLRFTAVSNAGGVPASASGKIIYENGKEKDLDFAMVCYHKTTSKADSLPHIDSPGCAKGSSDSALVTVPTQSGQRVSAIARRADALPGDQSLIAVALRNLAGMAAVGATPGLQSKLRGFLSEQPAAPSGLWFPCALNGCCKAFS